MSVHKSMLLLAIALAPNGGAMAQGPAITIAGARARAQQVSAELDVAREAVAVARGLERQSGAYPNPLISYSRERVGGGAQSASQDIVAAGQALEWPSLRAARREAASARRQAAEARLAEVEGQVAFDAVRLYAASFAAERRARLADTVAAAFATAVAVSDRRLAEGDISGFAARRIRLEAARYAVQRTQASLDQRSAVIALASALGDATPPAELRVAGWSGNIALALSTDSLVALALHHRGVLAAGEFDVEAARADARRASSERLPTPALSIGAKSEELPGGARLNGLVIGAALPLAVWDRRSGLVAASDADVRRASADLASVRLRVTREVRAAAEAFHAAQEQLGAVGAAVQADAAAALRSAQTAYVEGEATLLEWLDTVRAYQETEVAIANLRAEVLLRAAALERAAGAPLFQELR